jgi:hypothetical protein
MEQIMIARHFAASLLAMGLLVGVSANPSLAQTDRMSSQPNATQGAAPAPAAQAPTGHRQPRAGDLPAPSQTQDRAEEAEKKADERLQKVLQSICRGC